MRNHEQPTCAEFLPGCKDARKGDPDKVELDSINCSYRYILEVA